ncbi:MAG: LysM peptidoglycan-binding domain-containing protein [Caldilineaceae bacterium]|nr:LysM peptidoglycan-binding domain-containing protein [Caldilineaceae bacterium]
MREQIRLTLGRLARDLQRRLRQASPRQRKLWSAALALIVVAVVTTVAALPRILRASEESVLANGGFEDGFVAVPGCGIVGSQWNCFTNGGAANYGFYDDSWDLVVAEGDHSQLIEINTKGMAAGDNDRYAGLSQTARVVKGQPYRFSMRGMIRTTSTEGDPWRYSVQVGTLDRPNGDWRDVTNWVDVGWNTYYPRTEPGSFSDFQTVFVPQSEVITVFIRVWKKWGVAFEELDVNLDAIALVGPPPHRQSETPKMGGMGGPVGEMQDGPMQDGPMQQGPAQPMGWSEQPQWDRPLVCNSQDLVYNGSFEQGFADTPLGDVGRGWGAFTNGGAAAYGFYDEQWTPVVADGKHGQLIEINSKGIFPTDADRYAGIYQRLDGLHPGATYELTLRGLLRGVGNEEEPYRFAAQWGIGRNPDWMQVEEWTEMDLGAIYPRTEPGAMGSYTVRFEAPGPQAVLFIRGWNKWAVTNVEMDFNLDAISVRACEPAGGGMAGQDQGRQGHGEQGGPQVDGANCLYVVKPGDSLGAIAERFGVSMDVIMRTNGVTDADMIYVGQKFEIPGCGKSGQEMGRMEGSMEQGPIDGPQRPGDEERPMGEGRPDSAEQPRTAKSYAVREGDSLGAIAERFGVDVYALASANGIDNMNMIYAGQELHIP